MESLKEAARKGDINRMNSIVASNQDVLLDFNLYPEDNPMHIASKNGHWLFIRELLKMEPLLASIQNSDGYNPMHLAAANGHKNVVKELLSMDRELCLKRDRDGWIPLHRAVLKSRIEVILELLSENPESIRVLTHKGENCLHLAVKHNQCHVFPVLLKWLANRKDLINTQDNEGNTVLHLVTFSKQFQALEMLLSSKGSFSSMLHINSTNDAGLTALDLCYQNPVPDMEIVHLLHGAGARRAQDLIVGTCSQMASNYQSNPNQGSWKQILDPLIQFSPDVRNVLLLLPASLIASALQALGSPFNDPSQSPATQSDLPEHYRIWEVLLGSGKHRWLFYAAMSFTTMFMGSIFLVIFLIWTLPLRIPIIFVLVNVIVYYCFAMAMTFPQFIILFGSGGYKMSSYCFMWLGVLVCSITTIVALVSINAILLLAKRTRWGGLKNKLIGYIFGGNSVSPI